MKHFFTRPILVWAAIAAAVTVAYANLDAPPPGHTGAPGEGSCADSGCHGLPPTNWHAGLQVFPIDQGAETITIDVHMSACCDTAVADSLLFGFMATVLDSAANPVGTLSVLDSHTTKLLPGPGGREYVSHTANGARNPDLSHQWGWIFLWTRPPGYESPVFAYVCGVAANGDQAPSGDFVLSATKRLSRCMIAITGDLNCNRVITSADIIDLIHVVFKNVPRHCPCLATADVNCSGLVTSADIIVLVNYVFKGAGPLCDVCTLVDAGTWSCD